jgi:hypothetical protein
MAAPTPKRPPAPVSRIKRLGRWFFEPLHAGPEFAPRPYEPIRERLKQWLFDPLGDPVTPGGQPAGPRRWRRNQALIRLSPYRKDDVTIEKAFRGTFVIGRTGSSKTTGVLQTYAKTFLRNDFGGLVLCAKQDEIELWQGYLRACGREKDARFFGPEYPLRFNFLRHEASRPGVQVGNLVKMILRISSTRPAPTGQGGDNAGFWLGQKETFLANAMRLLMLAKEPVDLLAIARIYKECPRTPAEAKHRDFAKTHMGQLLARANSRAQTPVQKRTADDLWHYYSQTWAGLDPETRSDAETDLNSTLDALTHDELGELFNGETNVTPEDIFEQGAVVVVAVPERVHFEAARHCALVWTQAFQRAADRRKFRFPHSRPAFLWKDECQLFAVPEDDRKFQSTCRGQGVAVVAATQNYPLLKAAYGSAEEVDAMVGNLVTKFFCCQDDPQTLEWASKMAGRRPLTRYGLSAGDGDVSSQSLSLNDSMEPALPPTELTRLKTGGEENGCIAEAIVMVAGHRCRKRHPWMLVRFNQNLP